MRGVRVGDYLVFPNKTIGKVISMSELGSKDNPKAILRKVSNCKGRYSNKNRIGKPYTYQSKVSIDKLNKDKRIRILSVEDILSLLYYNIK